MNTLTWAERGLKDWGLRDIERDRVTKTRTSGQFMGVKPVFYKVNKTDNYEISFENTKGAEIKRIRVTGEFYKTLDFSKKCTESLLEKFNIE